MLTHLYFDFFGTLVDYSPSRTEQGYEASHRLLVEAGATLGYPEFLAMWDGVASDFEREAEQSLVEYSMHQVCAAFLTQAFDQPAPPALLEKFIETYLREWNRGVVYLQELPAVLTRLASHHTLGVITNTHHPSFVPDHLERMGVAALFDTVVTSVEYGSRKPAAQIFEHALATLQAPAETSLYVGDSYDADYRGSRNAGMRSLLIDPENSARIPAAQRLAHILDLERHLGVE